MPETSIGKGFDSENNAEWQVEAWTGPGGLSDWRRYGENRLTRNALSDADHVVISYTYPDGTTEYRTFRGPVEDVEAIIEQWKAENSL